MKTRMFEIIIIFTFLIKPCHSQEKSLWIAGRALDLGMGKNQVIQLFKSNYNLKNFSEKKDEYLIITKTGPPYLPKGVIKFENGKLISIQKTWGQFEGKDIVKFGNTLNNLISKLNKKGEIVAIVKTSEGAREPDIVSNTIEVCFGKHIIKIYISESNDFGNNISIFESISK
jgi:hypothetical protein